jgi:NADH dehydrogenase FAD-containing subunit
MVAPATALLLHSLTLVHVCTVRQAPEHEMLIRRNFSSKMMTRRSFAALASSEVYDVAIVGAGMVGAAVAALLSKKRTNDASYHRTYC